MSETSNVTKVVFGTEAKESLLRGAETVAAVVGCTMGPRGRTVLIQAKGQMPVLTKDGITVAKTVKLKDPLERMGGDLLREAASRTNDVAGDGTTTATVVTYAMLRETHKLLAAGHSAVELSREIETSASSIIAWLKQTAKQVTTRQELEHVATISANGDRIIGELIANAMEKVGRHGIVTVEDAKGTQTSLELAEGLQFDRGYLSPYFVTHADRLVAMYDSCYVLVTDKKIATMNELVPVLEIVHRLGVPLLVIADEIEGEALQALVVNKAKANLKIVAVKAPGIGSAKEQMLEDIATLCGTKVFSVRTGDDLKTVTQDKLGLVKRAIVSAKGTTLVGTGKTKQAVSERLGELEVQLSDPTMSPEECSITRMRMARLAGGVAVIKVGGATEVEMTERRYRIEDALNATRAAAEEGIVAGGGTALLRAALETLDSSLGACVVRNGCNEPLKRITENAGKNSGLIEAKILEGAPSGDVTFGYNAASDKYEDLISAGVIDPVKVTRTAVENAASIASSFASMGAAIYDDEL